MHFLRKFEIQGIDLVSADVAAEDRNIVGREAAPPGAMKIAQVQYKLGMCVTNPHAIIARMCRI